MDKGKANKSSERGVTLIALIVMILLVVILSAVTIKGLTGDSGLLSSAETAAIDYARAAVIEKLNQNIRAEMTSKATMGKIATLRRNSRNNKKARRSKRCSNSRR